MDESTQLIKEYLDKLPPIVRSAVMAPEWRKRIGEISAKYSLHIDQTSALEYETMFVLIGIEAEEDFTANIEKEVGVSKLLAGQLATEVSDRVFKYILKLMEERSAPQPKRFESASPVKSQLPNTGLLSEMETIASQVKPHEPKIGEPPVNLPGMEETKVSPSPADVPVSKVAPPVPNYSTDPYREPLE